MISNWSYISEELDDEVCLTYDIIESLLNEHTNDIEVLHWWNFLSEISCVPCDELMQHARKIKESAVSFDQKERKYCELLKIEKPPSYHSYDSLLRDQINSIFKIKIPEKPLRMPWIFRWIYTWTDENNKIQKYPGLKLKTIIRDSKKGKIKINKLFRRASFTTKVKDGTPEKWAQDCLPVITPSK